MRKVDRSCLSISFSYIRPSLSSLAPIRLTHKSARPRSSFKRVDEHGRKARVYSWGVGAFGALGFGDLEDQDLPYPVRALDGQQISEIAASWKGCLAAGADGRVWRWGWDGSTRSLLSAARLRRSSPQILKTMQKFPFGPLTYNSITSSPHRSDLFGSGSVSVAAKGGGEGGSNTTHNLWNSSDLYVNRVSGGTEHVGAVTKSGKVFLWGSGFHGQLGHGNDYKQSFAFEPRMVQALKDQHIIQIACGYTHTLFLSQKGEIFSCGRVQDGCLGIKGLPLDMYERRQNVWVPLSTRHFDTQAEGLSSKYKVVKVCVGFRHSVCIDDKGNVWVCGKNTHGQLGLPDLYERKAFTKVPDLPEIIDIAAGQFHTLALTADRRVLSWGANRHGQCGRGDDDKPMSQTEAEPTEEDPEVKEQPEIPSEKRLSVAKSLYPGEIPLPSLTSSPARVFAGGLESGVITDNGECVLFGSGHELDGRTRPYLALTDVSVQQVAFGFGTSHALGVPRTPLTPPPPSPPIK